MVVKPKVTTPIYPPGFEPTLPPLDYPEDEHYVVVDQITGLTAPQYEVYFHPARFRSISASRRMGKTILLKEEVQRAAQAQVRGSDPPNVLIVGPSLKHIKDLYMFDVIQMFGGSSAFVRIDRTNGILILKVNNARIWFGSAENPTPILGSSLTFAIFDETQDLPSQIWTRYVRPALSDRQGEAIFAGSSRGMNNLLYETYAKGKSESKLWASWAIDCYTAGTLAPEEIEAAKEDTPEDIFRMEYLCEFNVITDMVYYAFDMDETLDFDVEDTGGDLLIGTDFNNNPLTSVVGVQVGDEYHIFQEYCLKGAYTVDLAEAITNDFPNRRIVICPDPSGQQKRTSQKNGNDHDILREYGMNVVTSKRTGSVQDRVTNVNMMFKNTKGTRRIKIHPRCTELIKCLAGLTYLKDTRVVDKKSGLDHMPDALGYLIVQRFPMKKREMKKLNLSF